MPNVALIKHDGMPLNIPAGDIMAILKQNNPTGELEGAKCLIVTSFQKSSLYWLADEPDEVYQAMIAALPTSKQDTISNWIRLEALAPFTEVEPQAPESDKKESEELSIEPQQPLHKTFLLPENPVAGEGHHYVLGRLIKGFEGSRERLDPYNEPHQLPKGVGVLKFHMKLDYADAQFFEWATLTGENMAALGSGMNQSTSTSTNPG